MDPNSFADRPCHGVSGLRWPTPMDDERLRKRGKTKVGAASASIQIFMGRLPISVDVVVFVGPPGPGGALHGPKQLCCSALPRRVRATFADAD